MFNHSFSENYYLTIDHVAGKQYTVNADVWSLGITAIELAEVQTYSSSAASNSESFSVLSSLLLFLHTSL